MWTGIRLPIIFANETVGYNLIHSIGTIIVFVSWWIWVGIRRAKLDPIKMSMTDDIVVCIALLLFWPIIAGIVAFSALMWIVVEGIPVIWKKFN